MILGEVLTGLLLTTTEIPQMSIPTPNFSPWFPWSAILNRGHSPVADDLLQRVGCYLLAHFDPEAPAGPADPADPRVFYIGETHGETTSMGLRLTQFGKSAGFHGEQGNGHYGAWGYPVEFASGHDGKGRRTVYVALCACPDDVAPHLKGIFPALIEQQSIWAHARSRGDIPRLNNSGRRVYRAPPPRPSISEDELDALLARPIAPDKAMKVACEIAQRLALAMGYDARRRALPVEYEGWRGAERQLEEGIWLYVGWTLAEPAKVTVSVFRGTTALFGNDGQSRAGDRVELAALLDTFWTFWNS